MAQLVRACHASIRTRVQCPRTHVKSNKNNKPKVRHSSMGHVPVILVLGRWKQEDPCGPPASQPAKLGLSERRHSDSKVENSGKREPGLQLACTHMFVGTPAYTCVHTYMHIYEQMCTHVHTKQHSFHEMCETCAS